MFHAREMLHRKALQLESCVSIELMLAIALVHVLPVLLENSVSSMHGCRLADALLAACKLLYSELGVDVK